MRLGGGELTVIGFTPAGNPAPGPAEDGAVSRRQAHGTDVIREYDGGRQLQEAHVVVVGQRVVGRVAPGLGDVQGHLVGVGPRLVDATQENRDAAGVTIGSQNNTTLFSFY